jgi:hypothetical protein
MKNKVEISLNEYCYNCGDGCCTNYGTITIVNGVELECHNQDTETIAKQILQHLGYEVEIKTMHNGEEQ